MTYFQKEIIVKCVESAIKENCDEYMFFVLRGDAIMAQMQRKYIDDLESSLSALKETIEYK